MDYIVRVKAPDGVTGIKVYVVYLDAKGVQVDADCDPVVTPYPKHSDVQFDELLKAFSELKEENKKLKERDTA
jgi:hypothetical protein